MSGRRVTIFLIALQVAVLALALFGEARASSDCEPGETTRVWTAPLEPRPGEPLKILAVSTDDGLMKLRVIDPAGGKRELPAVRGGGPPWSLRGELSEPVSGSYRIEAMRSDRVAACGELLVGGGAGNRGSGEWDLATQSLYAAWVEHLFDAPPGQSLSFPSLDPVLRDSERNFLHDYLKKGEDELISAEPDCADLPYFLRAYFAWKLGLPVAYHPCDRGNASRPPRCTTAKIDLAFAGTAASAEVFREAYRRLVDTVHSGSARTALRDDDTDFYPVPLDRAALWPGTVFADPYGHTLVIVKWVPQTEDHSGLLLAVDAQPDNSVARKRFWEGNFLFAPTSSAGPGFKAYRAPVPGGPSAEWLQLANEALDGHSGLPPYSAEQEDLATRDFYARMARLINPRGLDPDKAYAVTLEALMEQLETRVRSVDNGEAYIRDHPDTVIPMPRGSAIFETVGPWEDYSTPSRDMRLLIAMDVLADLSGRIRRHPELYLLRGEDAPAAAAHIERLHAREIRKHFITYSRSDGSPWRLSLAEIYRRRPALEIAYNPNDCVERRWGAAPDTPEFSPCRRRAPAEQRKRMEKYRPWFHEKRRPPR